MLDTDYKLRRHTTYLFHSKQLSSELNLMEVGNKRNRDAEDDDPDDLDVQADNGLRRRLISVICGLVTVMHIFMGTKSVEPVHQSCVPLME